MVKTAEKYIGVRYRFGGNDPTGFDCSGYSSYVYKLNGLLLPHSAQQQFANGRRIGIRKAKPGDLVFSGFQGGKFLTWQFIWVTTGLFMRLAGVKMYLLMTYAKITGVKGMQVLLHIFNIPA